MTDKEIIDETTLRQLVSGESFLLFKHSPICGVSEEAFGQYRSFLEAHPDAATGWIDVIGQRPAVRQLAAETGVRHESPQALLFRNGNVVWSASHWSITRETLEGALVS